MRIYTVLIGKLRTKSRAVTEKMKVMFISMEHRKYIPVVLIFVISSIFSFYKVGSSVMNIDGDRWYLRTAGFMKEVKRLNFEKTYQNSKPGITVMWLSGISSEVFYQLYEAKYHFRPDFFTYETFPLVFTSYVSPLVLVNLLSGLVFYFLVKELTHKDRIALFSYILFAFHPFYLGLSRFLHVDSLMTNFVVLSYLFFLLYLKKQKQLRFLFLSGILFGLALLTKTQALVVLPIMFVSSVLHFLSIKSYLSEPKQKSSRKIYVPSFIKVVIRPLLICCSVALIVYFIVFPAMWVKPINTLKSVFSEAAYVATTGRSVENVKPFYSYILMLDHTISYPILGIFLAGCIYIFLKRDSIPKETRLTYLQLMIFPFIYFLEISVVKQKIDRYLLPAFPFVFIGCSIFLSQFKYADIIAGISALVLVGVLIYYAPNYPIFGCGDYECTYGYMFKEVGDYINANTNRKHPNVVTMTKVNSLKPFINGNTFTGEIGTIPSGLKVDYLVTNASFIKTRGIPNVLSNCSFLHRVYFHNVTFYDIYSCYSGK